MLVNSPLTVYHKGFDETSRTETWTRYNYDKVWFFGGRGSGRAGKAFDPGTPHHKPEGEPF